MAEANLLKRAVRVVEKRDCQSPKKLKFLAATKEMNRDVFSSFAAERVFLSIFRVECEGDE